MPATSILYWPTRLQLITWFPSNIAVECAAIWRAH